ncbi:hypothetical protein NC651_023543 [Populus alba x Populus x berolinensis]|nr:hypothetical protein NC651_023543 [Populus alba x Populus x berolinensis]
MWNHRQKVFRRAYSIGNIVGKYFTDERSVTHRRNISVGKTGERMPGGSSYLSQDNDPRDEDKHGSEWTYDVHPHCEKAKGRFWLSLLQMVVRGLRQTFDIYHISSLIIWHHGVQLANKNLLVWPKQQEL